MNSRCRSETSGSMQCIMTHFRYNFRFLQRNKIFKQFSGVQPKIFQHPELFTELKQEIVFKKDKATLHVISKRCEDSKLFQLN